MVTRPVLEDALIVLGAVGAAACVGGLFGALWGGLLLSSAAVTGGVLIGRNGGVE